MGKRRKLRGKKLLIVTGALAGAALFGCGDDGGSDLDSAVANLLPPADSSLPPADSSTPTDSAADSAASDGATTDGATDDAAATDASSDGAADATADSSEA